MNMEKLITGSVAVAYLRSGDKYLLMKRAANKSHYPNVWDGVGGWVEDNELREPGKAVLREIYEESGIEESDIVALELKYLHISFEGGYLTHHYIYFGETCKTDVWQTDEGALSWVERRDFLDREFSEAMGKMVRHYFEVGEKSGTAYIFAEYGDEGTFAPF